ncbi:hypothetical protein [Candidatus Regiella endosymbiont of Tuberolachnus salignus]|uniref:hypothetical protein n=1 Tax=Candidatus Regiella endosymbiont of Tuberolachnus salignus TaxID=3077956 RepID=UPI0030CFCAC5
MKISSLSITKLRASSQVKPVDTDIKSLVEANNSGFRISTMPVFPVSPADLLNPLIDSSIKWQSLSFGQPSVSGHGSATSQDKLIAFRKRPADDSTLHNKPAKYLKISGLDRENHCSQSNSSDSSIGFSTPNSKESIGNTDTDEPKKAIEDKVDKFFQTYIKDTVKPGKYDEVTKKLVELCRSVNEDKDRFRCTSQNNYDRNPATGAIGIKYSKKTKKLFREVMNICQNVSTSDFYPFLAICSNTLDNWLK